MNEKTALVAGIPVDAIDLPPEQADIIRKSVIEAGEIEFLMANTQLRVAELRKKINATRIGVELEAELELLKEQKRRKREIKTEMTKIQEFALASIPGTSLGEKAENAGLRRLKPVIEEKAKKIAAKKIAANKTNGRSK